jgi:hypothetical protein
MWLKAPDTASAALPPAAVLRAQPLLSPRQLSRLDTHRLTLHFDDDSAGSAAPTRVGSGCGAWLESDARCSSSDDASLSLAKLQSRPRRFVEAVETAQTADGRGGLHRLPAADAEEAPAALPAVGTPHRTSALAAVTASLLRAHELLYEQQVSIATDSLRTARRASAPLTTLPRPRRMAACCVLPCSIACGGAFHE